MSESKFGDEDETEVDDINIEFISRFAEHIDNNGFNEKIDNYVKDQCHMIEFGVEELPLELMPAYEGFQKIIDDELETFAKKEGMTNNAELMKKFTVACKKYDYCQEFMVHMLNAAEFSSFVELLRNAWRQVASDANMNIPGEGKNDDDDDDDEEDTNVRRKANKK